MLDTLMLSQGLLWIVVIILAVVCLALTRQIGILYERIAPAGALAMNQRLSGGDVAPAMSLTDLAGQRITLGVTDEDKVANSQLLFFLSPSCPICKTLLPVLKSIRQHEQSWLDIVFASDGDDEQSHQDFITAHKLQGIPYILSQALGISYGVSKLPYAVLIDEQGVISALGMVNSREHLESLFEAKWLGKHTIQDYLDEQFANNTYEATPGGGRQGAQIRALVTSNNTGEKNETV